MKIDYLKTIEAPSFDLDKWLKSFNKKEINSSFWAKEEIDQEYEKVIFDLNAILNTTENLTDSKSNLLTHREIYNAINYYKVRIKKLMMIYNLKIYITTNVNKVSNVKYTVTRAFWIDNETGKPKRQFSKNLGPQNKVLINGKIPKHLLNQIAEDMIILMWDLYNIEYGDPDVMHMDNDGNWLIGDGF